MARPRKEYLKKFNAFLNRLSTPLNMINIVVGLLIGIAHVYIPLPSIGGLLLGIAMACSSSASIGISYYFTSVNTRNSATEPKHAKEVSQPELQATRQSKIFLALAIPMILLNSAGSFFGMYTGVPLLALALGTPVGPALLTVTLVLATVLALGTLINSWLQVHYLAQKLKTPIASAVITEAKEEDQVRAPRFERELSLDYQPVFIQACVPKQRTSLRGGIFFSSKETQKNDNRDDAESFNCYFGGP